MGASSSMVVGVDLAELMDAISAGDWPRADTLVQAAGRISGEALQPAALVHLQLGRYAEAARLLSRVIDRDPGLELSRNYARNLAAMAEHRPGTLERIEATPADETAYQLAEAAGGRYTINQRLADGRVFCLSRDDDPLTSMRQSLAAVHEASETGQSVALYGLGDGYLLKALATAPPDLPFNARQTVYIIEPDARLLHVALMIHDYAGATGPIADRRFVWLIGDDWVDQLLTAMRDEPYLAPPAISAKQTPDCGPIDAGLAQVAQSLSDEQRALTERIESYYDDLTADALRAMFADAPPRRPRVMLLTTRYSTVLHHSTADAAAAFDALGWATHTIIEPADHLTITSLAMKRAIAAFKPDLVLQIDHLRHEHGEMFPANLPFACWVQDHLPNLTDAEVGQQVGPRDFVLTAVRAMYRDRYAYPDAQLIDFSKLTRVPERPTTWQADGDDLVFVSNAGLPSANIIERIIDACRQAGGDPAPIERACALMIEHYAAGGSLGCYADIERLIASADPALAAALPNESFLRPLLHARLNNALYRQQAIDWAVEIADRRGLSVALYGQGWAENERFARYAHGPVRYGADLEQLTRRSKINLQVVPYFCMHQRLLDGLVAGGFFLVRAHPADRVVRDLARAMSADDKAAIERLKEQAYVLREAGEPTQLVRAWQAAQVIDEQGTALPRYDDVAFADCASLAAQIDRYIDDDGARQAVADEQRRSIEHRLSYTAGMRRMIAAIGRRLRKMPCD